MPASTGYSSKQLPRLSSSTPLYLHIIVMVAVIVPLIALCQVIAYWRNDVVDDQMFGYYGWRIAHGATVYLDVWDNKPPGIYWINAVGMLLGGGNYLGVIAMCTLALVVAHVSFFITAASVYDRGSAAITTILLSFYLTHAFYTGGTNRTETFVVACELTAVAFYMRGFARDRWWKWYAAGLMCGLAFLFKQVGLAAWGSMGLHVILLVILRRLAFMSGLKRCLLLLGGASTTVGLGAAYLAARGALYAACFASFGFNRAYFEAGASQFPYNFVTWTLLRDHVYPILLLPLLMAAAATIHALLWWARPRYRPSEIEQQLRAQRPVCPMYYFFFTLWFLVAMYGALISPHGFRHYLVPTIPPLMLMAGYLINVLRAETRLVQRLQDRAWVVAMFVVIGYFALGAVKSQWAEVSKIWVYRIDPYYFHSGTYDAAHWEVVGDAIRRHTRPDDRVHCWGYMPGAYLRARRINACRFTTTEKPGQVGEAGKFVLVELEQTLRDNPPALITIQDQDYRWLHGVRLEDGLPLPSDVNLGPWLDQNYTLVEEIPKYGTVYVFKLNQRLTTEERQLDLPDPHELLDRPCPSQPPPLPTQPLASRPAQG